MIEEYRRGIPTYKGEKGQTVGMLCETKEQCITDDNGVQLPDKLAELKEYTDNAYANSNLYTDTKIGELINGAPTTLDTLKEIADAMEENADVVEALDAAVGSKVAQEEYDGHAGNETIHITAEERERWNNNSGSGGVSSDADTVDGLHANEIADGTNLLINSDFTNPVNTSGSSSWTIGTTATAVFDTWYGARGIFELTSDGITIAMDGTNINPFIQNRIPKGNLAGKDVTFSAEVDGTVYSVNLTVPTTVASSDYSEHFENGLHFGVGLTSTQVWCTILNDGSAEQFTVTWAKLEIGKQATAFIPSNPEVEKLKCGLKADNADHNIKTYTTLEQLGLSDDDMSATDFATNLTSLMTALPNRSIFMMTSGSYTNFTASVNTQLNSDMGLTNATTTGFVITINKPHTVNACSEIKVMLDTGAGRKRIYTCIFDTSNSVVNISKFAESFNADGFLPLTGGELSDHLAIKKSTYPTLKIINTTTGRQTNIQAGDSNTAGINNDKNNDNHVRFYLFPETYALDTIVRLRVTKDGVTNYYNMLHTGNSAPCVVVDTDPGVGVSVSYADGTLIFVKE